MINSVGQLGGIAGPAIVGYFNDRTHSLTASFAFIVLAYIVGGVLILSMKIRNPLDAAPARQELEK